MSKPETEPLEKKDVLLFKGDWAALEEILSGTALKPTTFIRKLVRMKIRQIQARQQRAQVEDVEL